MSSVFIERGLDSFSYVPVRDGYNSGEVLATISGTPAISGSNLRLTSARASGVAAFTGHLTLAMRLIIQTEPTAGHARQFGLRNPGNGLRGAILFDVNGTTFSAKVYDHDGSTLLLNQAITWDAAWTNTETEFKIMATQNEIQFHVGGSIGVGTNGVAQYQCPEITRHKLLALPLFVDLNNGVADNMDLVSFHVLKASNLT